MKPQKGFTLIEMMAAMAVLVVLAVTAVAMFSRSLKSSTRVESVRILDSSAKVMIEAMSKLVREGEVQSVGVKDRVAACVLGGEFGNDVKVRGLDGADTTYQLSGTNLASNSSVLNPSSVEVTNLGIGWTCGDGVMDVLNVSFTLGMTVGGSTYEGVDVSQPNKDFSFSVTMRNSNY